MSLSATVTILASATETSALDLGTGTIPLAIGGRVTYADGTAAGQADKIWTDTRTIAASGTENLDLAGVLLDALGGTALTFAKIKSIVITADPANTNNVVVGGAASNTFVGPFADATDKVSLKPGMRVAFDVGATAAGWTVTAGTADILLVANSGGTTGVSYSIMIVGTSA